MPLSCNRVVELSDESAVAVVGSPLDIGRPHSPGPAGTRNAPQRNCCRLRTARRLHSYRLVVLQKFLVATATAAAAAAAAAATYRSARSYKHRSHSLSLKTKRGQLSSASIVLNLREMQAQIFS